MAGTYGYSDPQGTYLRQTQGIQRQKGLEDATRQYAQGLSQERFRRNREDQTTSFKRNFPKVGTHYNRRGMWNSGMRQQGQREFAGDFQRNVGRTDWDQAAQNQAFQMDQVGSDAQFQAALQSVYDQMQREKMLQGAYDQAKVY